MNVVGYMLVLRIHELDDVKCEVWLSYCVLVIFEKIGQKRRSLILMIVSRVMKLLC